MSTIIKRINNFFKTAIRSDIDKVESEIILSDRQKQIFDMFYIKKQNIDFIADYLNVCPMVINNELKTIRQKMIKILGL